MKQYPVRNHFRDKNTGEYHSVGSYYETADEERAVELQQGGYLAPAETELPPNQTIVTSTLGELLKQNVDNVVDSITDTFTAEELTELKELETAGKNRKTVLEHIDSLLGAGDGQL
ncbi:hypothetical protein ACFFJY_08045 [Fictibacillus aquaticus]|uniref:Uncharacterized protein n=1 Tax=Fictibacillus aquaticus TaxID=2021314 RepID=A0A235F9Z4_9BACL|nr:hypothetical protein [Fictibacillus aquaticus]OYD57874.1 hypothetical protein CGZ90_08200 [Fictibacillus aquaticus]